ncbi:hypothetical protein C9374_007467 [Naegleria lovaniensis]|uniref:Uncharacterized protein n=1 Tax=Naegleria lovaniensis TaxID=51637 RepID=A0AA88GN37_NAELO|nr:uncharacterized protein C9374_007467 [Naegleria lovaniensis]KAG2379328.1 hypothetical protein C9374_007467 [Naegleria lovaniensis]
MKKQNPFAPKKVSNTAQGKKVIGSFVNEDQGSSSGTKASSKKSSEDQKKRKIETTTTSSSDDSFTSYPLGKKKKDSDQQQQPNVGRVTESMMRASMVKPEAVSDSSSSNYIKPLPANFFDTAPSEYDKKKIQEGYKDLTKSGKSSGIGAESIIKDKGFAKIVNSAVIKKKIDKTGLNAEKPVVSTRQTKAERNLETLEQELDEREDAEEMKRQLEEFLKIEEIRKQTEALVSTKSNKDSDGNNITDKNEPKATEQLDESDDELEMNWKSKSLKKK